ncbi:MAG: DUF4411 family protein, partial [Bacteroidetes bacterium]|nr:DUF4411 family protein [Bacteroidota bacterium]MDE2671768.1 DUF4411 family protein [Bacteroidota bacterium]
ESELSHGRVHFTSVCRNTRKLRLCKSEHPKDKQFKEWLAKNKTDLIFYRDEQTEFVRRVITEGYGGTLTDVDLNRIGGDPFLIASALEDPKRRTVVTEEVSKPSAQGVDRKIPDICKDLKVRCINILKFIKTLNFKTNWKEELPESELRLYSGSGSATPSLFNDPNSDN